MSQAFMTCYSSARAITPSDTVPIRCRGIYVGGAGNLAVSFDGGATTVVFTGLAVGRILELMLTEPNGRVMAASTRVRPTGVISTSTPRPSLGSSRRTTSPLSTSLLIRFVIVPLETRVC